MDILDVVKLYHRRPFLRQPHPSIDIDLKKIMTVAIKAFIIGSNFPSKQDAFSAGFAVGVLSGFITKKEFKFKEINRLIDQYPLQFLQTAIFGHLILYPADLELGAIASGFYSGIGIANLCK